jgi:hypothetical protein
MEIIQNLELQLSSDQTRSSDQLTESGSSSSSSSSLVSSTQSMLSQSDYNQTKEMMIFDQIDSIESNSVAIFRQQQQQQSEEKIEGIEEETLDIMGRILCVSLKSYSTTTTATNSGFSHIWLAGKHCCIAILDVYKNRVLSIESRSEQADLANIYALAADPQ